MLRRIGFIILIVFAFAVLRRLLSKFGPAARPPADSRGKPSIRPAQLVCGICGTAYDPASAAGLCPKCRK